MIDLGYRRCGWPPRTQHTRKTGANIAQVDADEAHGRIRRQMSQDVVHGSLVQRSASARPEALHLAQYMYRGQSEQDDRRKAR